MSTPRRTARMVPRTATADYERLEELRRQLREELKARLGQLRVALTPADAAEVNDIEALCDNSSSAGISAAIVGITSRTLQGIEGALGRLERGTYGRCSDCGAGSGRTAASDVFRRTMPGVPGAGRRRSQRARRVTGLPPARSTFGSLQTSGLATRGPRRLAPSDVRAHGLWDGHGRFGAGAARATLADDGRIPIGRTKRMSA